MTPEQFAAGLKSNQFMLVELVATQLPVIVGKEAVYFFTKNFYTESFEGKKWKEVKRRQATWTRKGKVIQNPTRGAARSRKILTGRTANLGRSLQYKPSFGSVTIYSDLIYAPVHNFGLNAGRGNGFKMPKRQFIGNSVELEKIIETKIFNEINKIFKP